MKRCGPTYGSPTHKGGAEKSEQLNKGSTCTNSSGLPQFHLWRKHQDVEYILDFRRISSTIGWKDNQVGFNVDSSDCCRVNRREDDNAHYLHDDDKCVYVDSVKTEGSHKLLEGETVQFGSNTSPQYIFETCRCGLVDKQGVDKDTPTTKRKTKAKNVMSPKRIKIDEDEPLHNYSAAERITMATERVKSQIGRLAEAFDAIPSLRGSKLTQGWSEELEELQMKLKCPKTIISVVGPTGAGKSSLMNAILDHRILPTAGIGEACTATIVEVVQNEASDDFEAEVEFLQEKEWFEELKILVQELTKPDGKIRKQPPNNKSDTYESYHKLMAAYGAIDTIEKLRKINTVTDRLGKVDKVSAKDPEDFRLKIGQYIEAQDTEESSGSQFWPIVKRVVLKIPKCAICSNGATLVDLPGAGDSNAARDKIASEYMKKCTAVWVVSAIQRAANDKTANDLLEDGLKRQLYSDGLMGSINFICTKTDELTPSEIIRRLNLKDKVNPYVQAKEEMTSEIAYLEKKKSDIGNRIDMLSTEIEQKTESHASLQHQRAEFVREKEQITAKILTLEKDKVMKDHDIKAVCAKARNEYVKPAIRRRFGAILKALKNPLDNDEDEEEEDDSDDNDNDNTDAIDSMAKELKVFCCSAKEYQTGKKMLTDDGPPQVFNNIEDTGIPELRNHIQEMVRIQQEQRLEKLIQGLECLVAGVQSFIDDKEVHENNQEAKNKIDSQILAFKKSFITFLMEDVERKIDNKFENIQKLVNKGANVAKENAEEISSKWGGPVERGGYPCKTYQATVRRNGKFISPVYGRIDFNERLSDPIMTNVLNSWVEVFNDNGSLLYILANIRCQTVDKLKQFTSELGKLLADSSVATSHSTSVFDQFLKSSAHKLERTLDELKKTITSSQRDITREMGLPIRQAMEPTYTVCSPMKGKDVFKYIKEKMSAGVEDKRETMFNDAAHAVNQGLEDLKTDIKKTMKCTCEQLVEKLSASCQPLWNVMANRQEIKDGLAPCINEVWNSLQKIKIETGLKSSNVPQPSTSGLQYRPVGNGGDTAGNHVWQGPPARPQLGQR